MPHVEILGVEVPYRQLASLKRSQLFSLTTAQIQGGCLEKCGLPVEVRSEVVLGTLQLAQELGNTLEKMTELFTNFPTEEALKSFLNRKASLVFAEDPDYGLVLLGGNHRALVHVALQFPATIYVVKGNWQAVNAALRALPENEVKD